MSTHNIGFYEDLTKIIFELSSNTHLISSAVSIHKQIASSKTLTFSLPVSSVNSFDPDQAPMIMGPDLGPNCLTH